MTEKNIIAAEVFDPALSGDFETPPRLELQVSETFLRPEDEPFYEEVGPFDVTHYRWLAEIENVSDTAWPEMNEAERAAKYNSSMFTEGREPVVPVTVMIESQEFWTVYYAKVSRVRSILNYIRKEIGATVYYEVVPDETYADEKMSAYTFMHPARKCVRCVNDLMEQAEQNGKSLTRFEDVGSMCPLQKVAKHRKVPMCEAHRAEYTNEVYGFIKALD